MLIIEAKIPSDNANMPHIFADWYLEFVHSFNSEIPDAWKYAIIAAMLASLSGFFITGGFNGLTQASFVTALRALPAIVIGGLDSLVGAVVGSLIVGLTQGYIAYYQIGIENSLGISFGSGFSLLAPYLIMFIILIIRPDGLFGKEEVERVWEEDLIYL